MPVVCPEMTGPSVVTRMEAPLVAKSPFPLRLVLLMIWLLPEIVTSVLPPVA